MADYPALEALAEAQERLGVEHIAAFLDWLNERGIRLCLFEPRKPAEKCPHYGLTGRVLIERGVMQLNKACPGCGEAERDLRRGYEHANVRDAEPEGWFPLSASRDSLISSYLGIDTAAVERERRAMLDALRACVPPPSTPE